MVSQETVQPFIDEALRIEEDATFSAKGHFEAARSWGTRHYWIGIPTTVVAAAAGVLVLNEAPKIAATLAFLVATTSALFTFLNPKQVAGKHLGAGNAFKALQNDARIFRQIQVVLSEHRTRRPDTRDLAAFDEGPGSIAVSVPRAGEPGFGHLQRADVTVIAQAEEVADSAAQKGGSRTESCIELKAVVIGETESIEVEPADVAGEVLRSVSANHRLRVDRR